MNVRDFTGRHPDESKGCSTLLRGDMDAAGRQGEAGPGRDSMSIDAMQSRLSTRGSAPRTSSNRRSPRSHHSLSTRTGSHGRIHRTYNPASRPSLRQP
jgi:hypothetical protein